MCQRFFAFFLLVWADFLLVDENGTCAIVYGIGTVNLKDYIEKTGQLRNVHHTPSIRKNSISGYQLCRDGYIVVFESNKCVLSKYRSFVEKDYDIEGLFRLSLDDACNNSVDNVFSYDKLNFGIHVFILQIWVA